MPRIRISLDTIPVNKPTRVEHADTAVVVIRGRDGVTAFPDVCPHAFWRLSDGELVNGNLECPGHGWEFDVATGAGLTVPSYCLQPLAVRVEAGNVHVEWDESACPMRGGPATRCSEVPVS